MDMKVEGSIREHQLQVGKREGRLLLGTTRAYRSLCASSAAHAAHGAKACCRASRDVDHARTLTPMRFSPLIPVFGLVL
jgi:hypothetical protein